jgi:uncharacterized protein YjiS (DUF1127 family)
MEKPQAEEAIMITHFRTAIRNSQERARYHRQYAALLELDDHLLMHGIGVRRDEVRSRMAG